MLDNTPLLHLIVNPTAGRGRAAVMLPQIQAYLTQREQSFTTAITTHRGHAREIASSILIQPHQTIVAIGGDGTLHEVTNAILDTEPALNPTLGLIACGTGNDFATCVGIQGTVEQMTSILLDGVRKFVDVGVVESHDLASTRFLAAAGVGFIADTAITVNKGIRFLRGMPAYIYGAIVTLAKFECSEVSIRVDETPVRDLEVTLISLSNVATTGGGMQIAPGALFDDGLLNVCLVHKISKWELLRQLPNVIKGFHTSHPSVEMHSATIVEISSKKPMSLWIDGEVMGTTPAKFTIERSRLPMLLPRR